MLLRELVKLVQAAMNQAGANPKLTEDGEYGAKSSAESDNYSFKVTAVRKQLTAPEPGKLPTNGGRPINPGYTEAKKYAGQGEQTPGFRTWLSSRWKAVSHIALTTIVGASAAWCGHFVGTMQTDAGLPAIVRSPAGAKNWGRFDEQILHGKMGLPRSAIVHINHAAKNAKTVEEHTRLCNSGSNNHVGYVDGDCTVQEIFGRDVVEMVKDKDGVWRPTALAKPGAVFPVYGGNQGNQVRRSMFSAGEICEVRWPKEIAIPPPVTKSIGCSGAGASGDSTR